MLCPTMKQKTTTEHISMCISSNIICSIACVMDNRFEYAFSHWLSTCILCVVWWFFDCVTHQCNAFLWLLRVYVICCVKCDTCWLTWLRTLLCMHTGVECATKQGGLQPFPQCPGTGRTSYCMILERHGGHGVARKISCHVRLTNHTVAVYTHTHTHIQTKCHLL